MFIDLHSHLVMVAFKLTIFTLLIIQLHSLGKKYILPFLRTQIAEMNKSFENLKNKHTLLGETKTRIKKQIGSQEATLTDFEKKIKLWHESRQTKQDLADETATKQYKLIREKKIQQQEYISLMKLQQKTIPVAFAQAEKKLREIYEGTAGEASLNRVLTELKHK